MKQSLLLFLLLLISACVEAPADPNNPNNNMPVIINTTNNYTFTVHAVDYSINNSDQLSFNSDSMDVYITLGNYSDGEAIINVTSDTATIFTDTLKSNKTYIQTGIAIDIPNQVSMNFDEFNGDLSIILKAGGN